MDPDKTLEALRDALDTAEAAAEGGSNDEEIQAWQEVGRHARALDEWLVKGGFAPSDWRDK